jgi:hypothetical protein
VALNGRARLPCRAPSIPGIAATRSRAAFGILPDVNGVAGAPKSRRERFLKGKTGWQRLLFALAAIATALIAIGTVVTGVVKFVGDRVEPSSTPGGGIQIVESQKKSADKFVRLLIEHDDAATLQLNHQVIGRKGPADVTLEYNCQSSGRCSTTRIQSPRDEAPELENGRWFQGCWKVEMKGPGYGVQDLDLALVRQGETCLR